MSRSGQEGFLAIDFSCLTAGVTKSGREQTRQFGPAHGNDFSRTGAAKADSEIAADQQSAGIVAGLIARLLAEKDARPDGE